MGDNIIQVTSLLLLIIGSSVAPPPPAPPTGPQPARPWFQKQKAVQSTTTQLSSATTSTDPQDILKLISAQGNGGLQSPPIPPVGTTINGKVNQVADITNTRINQVATAASGKVNEAATFTNTKVDQAAQVADTANSKLNQVAAYAIQGKDAVINTIKPKKTKEELVTELRNMIPPMESSLLAAKYLLANAEEKSQEEMDTEMQLIKNGLKPTINGPSQIMTQVNKAKDGIQGVVNNPSSVKDFKAVQAVTNHPITQGVVNHPITQGVVNHPITQKITSYTSPWIDKILKKDTPPAVM